MIEKSSFEQMNSRESQVGEIAVDRFLSEWTHKGGKNGN